MKQQDKINDIIKEKIALLPSKPGVYKFLDDSNKILYIGKAKDLKKEVSTYFFANDDDKLQMMVNKICDIKYTIIFSKLEALLLENNMIKKYQPPYNVLLEDDKTITWVCLKKTDFTRILFLTNQKLDDGAQYFGPYPSVLIGKMMLKLIKRIHTCAWRSLLTPEGMTKDLHSICIDFHVGNCSGTCRGL
jgi:excinuclease ABC subunit C